MDDALLYLLLAAIGLPVCCAVIMYFHKKRLDAQATTHTPRDVSAFITSNRDDLVAFPRQVAAATENREDISRFLGLLFAKQSGAITSPAPADEIPTLVLRLLDEAIDKASHLKYAHNILGRIDALENNTAELVKVVATDPLLTTSLLRLAKSAHYGYAGEVTSIRQAIDIVGLLNLKNLVFSECVQREHKGKPIQDPALFQGLWEHSLLSATAAAYLAPSLAGMDPAQAYMTALLHDIGKFLLLSAGLVETREDRCLRPYCGGFMDSTRLVWRHDHALVGKVAALKWNFGSEVGDLIGMHHYPEMMSLRQIKADPQRINGAVLLHLANQTAKYFSNQPGMANFIRPLHISYHHLVDPQSVRSILAGSNLIPELAKVQANMTLQARG